ncbi:hypothetical protein KR009_002849 [Drosophila setifemur]|nr:hypothetical protein KR009_002849 [Drosophila setifemur]
MQFTLLFAACVAVASAGLIPAAAPLAVAQVEEYDPHPQYTYGYDVKDAISGDSKTQVESRDGDVVQGQYSLNDADGYRRIVDYTADPINGFNAVVRREPLVAPAAVVAAPAPVVRAAAPVAVAAPVVRAAPLAYAAAPAPLTYAAAPAPLTYAAAPAPLTYAAAPAPLSYAAAAPIVKAAPLVAAGPAIVKTQFASPLISYAY